MISHWDTGLTKRKRTAWAITFSVLARVNE